MQIFPKHLEHNQVRIGLLKMCSLLCLSYLFKASLGVFNVWEISKRIRMFSK